MADEEISHDMLSEDKVIRLANIASDLQKKVIDLEGQQIHSTLLEVLEIRRDAAM